MRVDIVATIFGMAPLSYATRASGPWLMGHLQSTPRLERWLQRLPGTILAALIAPAALAAGPA